MIYAIKNGYHVKVIDELKRVETAGYDPIHASSCPPYGPHIERHKDRVWGLYSTNLENVRVIDPKTEIELKKLQEHITQLRNEYQHLLDDNFLSFRLTTLTDFDPSIISKGLTKEEALAKLPKGKEAKEMIKQGKMLAGLSKKISKVLR